MPGTRRAGAIVALYAACMLYLVPVFPHYPSANDLSRWATVASLVERGTLETSWTQPLIGPLVDASRVGDRVYSNKAPGLALLALPGYLAARPFLGPPTPANLRWSLYAMRVVAVTIPAVLLGLLVLRRTGGDPFAAATLLFATPVFVYGALLFSHVTVAALLVAAFELLFPRAPGSGRRAALAAGALCGLATLTEYPAALATVVLGVGILAETRPLAAAGARSSPGAPRSPSSLGLYNRVAVRLGAVALLGQRGVRQHRGARLPRRVRDQRPDAGQRLHPPRLAVPRAAVLLAGARLRARRAVAARRPPRAARAWVRLAVVAVLGLAMLGYPSQRRRLVRRRPLPGSRSSPSWSSPPHERGVRPGVATAACLAFSAALCVTPLLTFPFAPMEFDLRARRA